MPKKGDASEDLPAPWGRCQSRAGYPPRGLQRGVFRADSPALSLGDKHVTASFKKDKAMNKGFFKSSELSFGTFSFPAWGAGSSIQHHPLLWFGSLWLLEDSNLQLPEIFLSWQVISCFRDSHFLLLKLLKY